MGLSQKKIEEFRQVLEEMKRQYEQAVKDSSQEFKSSEEGKSHSQHQADQGTDDFGMTISIEVNSKESEVLHYIERALEKIEEGTFGKCDLTGAEIPLKRLEAIPYATMTVEAQEKLEKGEADS